MTTFALFCTILSDGTGDYAHFEDVVRYIRANKTFNNAQLILVVSTNHQTDSPSDLRILANIEKLKSDLSLEDNQFYYVRPSDKFPTATLQEQLAHVDLALMISADTSFSRCQRYCKKDVVVKAISEHEGSTIERMGSPLYKMGLGGGCYGIKLKNRVPLPFSEAVQIIQSNAQEFTNRVLNVFEEPDLTTIFKNNLIVPAYFNAYDKLLFFIHDLSNNQSIQSDILIYMSGVSAEKLIQVLKDRKDMASYFSTAAAEIELITPDQNEILNASNQKNKIRIFANFNLPNEAYKALYSLAKIAGVSGDNTLEMALSQEVIPYYYSTNSSYKRNTNGALINIIRNTPELNLSDDEKGNFEHILGLHDTLTSFDIESIQAWPKIVAHLREHYNIYNQLENILLCTLPGRVLRDLQLTTVNPESISVYIDTSILPHQSNLKTKLNKLKTMLEEAPEDTPVEVVLNEWKNKCAGWSGFFGGNVPLVAQQINTEYSNMTLKHIQPMSNKEVQAKLNSNPNLKKLIAG